MKTSDLERRVLIVDDQREQRLKYTDIVLHGRHSYMQEARKLPTPIRPLVSTASDAEDALAALHGGCAKGQPFHVLVTDLIMSPHDGLWLIEQLQHPDFDPEALDVVLVSAQDVALERRADIEKALKGWRDASGREIRVVLRAEMLEQVAEVLQKAEEQHEDEFLEAVWSSIWDQLEASAYRTFIDFMPFQGHKEEDWQKRFRTRNPQLSAKIDRLLRGGVAASNVPVLIIGETGTGKEVLARLIHAYSLKHDKPWVSLHLAALPENLQAVELFGYEKGAFTGAERLYKGKIEQAHGGTLFLDEVGELSLETQVKLLRVLQERSVDRLGGSRPIPVDFRLIAATKRDLNAAMEAGQFGADLYYRLEGRSITLPLLQERKEDIPALISYFWENTTRNQVPGRREPWTQGAIAFLAAMDWPGNARQLENFIEGLKVEHKVGVPVTDQVVREQKFPDYFDGLEEHGTYTSRRYHVLFSRALMAAIKAVPSGTELNDKFIIDQVMKTEEALFFEGNNDTSIQRTRDRIYTAWYDHMKKCSRCSLIWQQGRRK